MLVLKKVNSHVLQVPSETAAPTYCVLGFMDLHDHRFSESLFDLNLVW